MCVELIKGISEENAECVISWTNKRGADFLRQWAGNKLSFPLTVNQLTYGDIKLYSIMQSNEFVGIIQEMRREGSNVHIGRFVLNPEKTEQGIGTRALRQFCRQLFADESVQSVTLNVYPYNIIAQRCYKSCGFEVDKEYYENGQSVNIKMKLSRQ